MKNLEFQEMGKDPRGSRRAQTAKGAPVAWAIGYGRLNKKPLNPGHRPTPDSDQSLE